MRAIYKFHVDFGRMGDLTGVFVAEESELNNIMGKTIDFGEALGKHSEVFFELEEKHLTKVTDDQSFITLFDKFGLSTGYNPLDYYDEDYNNEEE